MWQTLAKYRKAIVGFVGAAAGPLIGGYVNDGHLSAGEIMAAVVAAFATLGIVIIVPNKLDPNNFTPSDVMRFRLFLNSKYGKMASTDVNELKVDD
jgi:hypothetical protein